MDFQVDHDFTLTPTSSKGLSVEAIKKLGSEKSEKNLDLLLKMFHDNTYSVEQKREIASSIGRQKNKDRIYTFLSENILKPNYMDVVYQMYRTILCNWNDPRFRELGEKAEHHYKNEMIQKMKEFHLYRQERHKKRIPTKVIKPTLLRGDSRKTLRQLDDKSVDLIFTSPPYYNAREYSDYYSYEQYLSTMSEVLKECYRVLDDGRFIIINVSPVITKRPGRSYESIRYPIHFDFHRILTDNDFYFVDEIVWVKPDYSVPNRNGGFQQTRLPLSYKPNCVTESVMVYRKKANFLLDKIIRQHKNGAIKEGENIDVTNCWHIAPKSDKDHPAVFPEELCRRILQYYSYENDVVLDPFAGSGTFGETAKKMKRIPILSEINENYINLLKEKGYYDI